MIGWNGPELVVLAKLASAGADRGDDGRFIVSGAPVRYTLKGRVLHVAIPVDAVFFVRGQRRSFATILEGVASSNPLLDKAANIYGPLKPEHRQAIMDYIATPTEEGWERIYGLIISPGSMRRSTLWQWVVVVDPKFPIKKGKYDRWQRIPDPMTVARAIKAAAESRAAAGNPRDARHKPPESAAQLVKLQERIAEKLGWSLKDVQSMSLQSLRENVRPVSPKLANELTYFIRQGVLLNPADAHGHCNGTSYDAAIRLRSGGRITSDLHARVYDAIERQPEIECVSTEVRHGTQIEVSARLSRKHARHGMPALDRALTRAVALVSPDLDITDLGHLVTFGIDRKWIVVDGEEKPISFKLYAEDGLDGEDGDDTRRMLEMMRAQGFPGRSPARIPMGSCDGKTHVVEVHRSRTDWQASKRARNPMSTAQEMLDAIYAWLVVEELTYGVSFKSPEQWRKLGWDKEFGVPERTEGFVIVAEGTNFNHALAGWMDHDRREEKKIVDSWNDLLERNGWGWSSITGWAFHVFPRQAQVIGSSFTPRAIAHTPPAASVTVTTPKTTTKKPRSRKRESNVGRGAA